jgi:tellurite resistance protein TehA-like permease
VPLVLFLMSIVIDSVGLVLALLGRPVGQVRWWIFTGLALTLLCLISARPWNRNPRPPS